MSQVLVGNREFHDTQAICQHITIGSERQIPLPSFLCSRFGIGSVSFWGKGMRAKEFSACWSEAKSRWSLRLSMMRAVRATLGEGNRVTGKPRMKNEGNTHFQFSILGFPVLRLRAKPALGMPYAWTRPASSSSAASVSSSSQTMTVQTSSGRSRSVGSVIPNAAT